MVWLAAVVLLLAAVVAATLAVGALALPPAAVVSMVLVVTAAVGLLPTVAGAKVAAMPLEVVAGVLQGRASTSDVLHGAYWCHPA